MYCFKCGKKIKIKNRFCQYCGIEQTKNLEESSKDSPIVSKKGKLKNPILTIPGFITFVIVFLFVNWLLPGIIGAAIAGGTAGLAAVLVAVLQNNRQQYKQEPSQGEEELQEKEEKIYFEQTRPSELSKRVEEINVEHRHTPKKSNKNPSGCLVVLLLTIGGFIGIFAIGAIASALSNKSVSQNPVNTSNNQIYQNNSNSVVSDDRQSLQGFQFPEVNRTAFKQSCIKEAGPEAAGISQSYCSCLLNYIEINYSFKEFLNIEQAYLKTKKFPPDIVAAMANCLK